MIQITKKLTLLILTLLIICFSGCKDIQTSQNTPVTTLLSSEKTSQTSQSTSVPTEKPSFPGTLVTQVPQIKEPTAIKYIMGEYEKKLVNSNIDFTFKLFKEVNKEDFGKNICISPLSITTALEMVYNGSKGETEKAMAKALEFNGLELEKINSASYSLTNSLKSSKKNFELAIANSLWLKEDLKFNPEFEKICREYYLSEVRRSITVDAVNNWCKENTKGKIPQILDSIDPNMAVLLANAIYFKGMWQYKFDKKKTKNEDFTLLNGSKKKVSMMSNHGTFNYYNCETFEAVSLPYYGKRLSMYIFLPYENSSLEAFQQNLNIKNWRKWMSSFHETEGQIVLPAFKMEYSKVLNRVLNSLGMGIAFSLEADFSKIRFQKDLFIDQVIHKTFIEVSEEGTEAAAVTATYVNLFFGGSELPPTFSMIVNRPFFFAIRDNDTGTILFMGTVVEP